MMARQDKNIPCLHVHVCIFIVVARNADLPAMARSAEQLEGRRHGEVEEEDLSPASAHSPTTRPCRTPTL